MIITSDAFALIMGAIVCLMVFQAGMLLIIAMKRSN